MEDLEGLEVLWKNKVVPKKILHVPSCDQTRDQSYWKYVFQMKIDVNSILMSKCVLRCQECKIIVIEELINNYKDLFPYKIQGQFVLLEECVEVKVCRWVMVQK